MLLPDPAMLRQAAADRATEIAFQQAYRLIARKQYARARKALQDIHLTDPDNPHVQILKSRIRDLEAEERERVEGLRSWRYSLAMNTTWRRICWGAAAFGLGIYSLIEFSRAIPFAFANGMAASITSQIQWRGRYGSSRTIDWTRPIFVDLIYSGLILAAAGAIMVVLVRVSSGAAQWEELDAGDLEDGF